MLDIDYLKRFNGRCGYPAGGGMLNTVGGLLLKKPRSYDCLARYGGDEFAVLLSHADSHGASIMSDRFRRTIKRAIDFFKAVTASCGATIISELTTEAEELRNEADRLALRGKAARAQEVIYANSYPRSDELLVPLVSILLPPHETSGSIRICHADTG